MNGRYLVAAALLAVAIIAIGACSAVAGIAKADGGIELTYDDPYAASVHLAGNFNNWSATEAPLTMDDDGTWRIVLPFDAGRYEYKFVVNGSEWVADPDNPKVTGDYGNSELTVNDEGEPVIGAAGPSISNTPLSARVNVNGWYRATYDTESREPNEPRWRLDRPSHEIYISVNPTVTPQVTGSATMRFDSGTGDIKELTADLYSGHIRLEGGPFTVTGFYNEEALQFDDPLETVGHIDLDGTITEEHIPFGRGAQGAVLEMEFLGTDLMVAYANQYDYHIMNDPITYDNTDTDLLAARLTSPLGPVNLGWTFTSWRDGWWVKYSGSNAIPELDDYLAESGTTSDWFELENTERWIGLDVDWPVRGDELGVAAEYAFYNYRGRWDVGNREKVEGTDFSNGSIDVPIGDVGGGVGRVIVRYVPMVPLKFRLEGTALNVYRMDPDEEFISFGSPVWAGEPLRQYTDVRFDGSPLVVNVFGPTPKRADWGIEFDAGFEFGIFDMGLEYDHDHYDWNYGASAAAERGDGRWEGASKRLATRFRANVLADRSWVELATESWSHDLDEGIWDPYDTFETIVSGRYNFTDEIGALADIRIMRYEDVPGSDGLKQETFWAPYLALAYSPRKNIELRLGYGIDPLSYTDTPVEGRANGRERWRSEYLWDHSDADVVSAERALEDARTLGVMAVISF